MLLLRSFVVCYIIFCGSLSSIASAAVHVFEFDKLEPWQTWMKTDAIREGVRFQLPGIADVNHIDGIGPIYLVAHLPMLAVGAHGPMDLRHAEITLKIRGVDIDLQGGQLVWWIVSDIPKTETNAQFVWQQTNWAFTGKPIDLTQLSSGAWSTLSATLDPAPQNWTYPGSNSSIHGAWSKRYAFYPVGKALANVNATLHLVVVGAERPPDGFIEIDAIEIATVPAPKLPDYEDLIELIDEGASQKAMPGLKLLADSGHVKAAYKYASELNYGKGHDSHPCLAKAYYTQAEFARLEAAIQLALLDLKGVCGTRDLVSALKRLTRAKSDPKARYVMAMVLLQGAEGKADIEIVKQHLQYAANLGHAHAMGELGLMYMNEDRDVEALFWLSLAKARSQNTDPRKDYLFGNAAMLLRQKVGEEEWNNVKTRIMEWQYLKLVH